MMRSIFYFALPADLVALRGRAEAAAVAVVVVVVAAAAVVADAVAAAAAVCCLLTVDVFDEDDFVGVSDSSGPLYNNK